MTTAHSRNDVRIFVKMCRSLAENGYKVNLLVCDGLGDFVEDRVNIVDCWAPKSRFTRMFIAPWLVLFKALSMKSDIYHFHDPELYIVGIILKTCGCHVIFDSHEDLPNQILSKHYLKPYLRCLLSFIISKIEPMFCRCLSGVITATPSIRNKFFRHGIPALDINNYPISNEFNKEDKQVLKKNYVCYVGDISEVRGSQQIIEAMSQVKSNSKLVLCGQFIGSENEKFCKSLNAWKRVDNLGFVSRKKVHEVLSSSVAGLVTFLPMPNHINSQPNKLFEYMACGLPIICSNFSLWREIVEGKKCGICIDPYDKKAIANAIDYLIANPNLVIAMGKNGKSAIAHHFNWAIETQKLLFFYNYILNSNH